MAPRIRTSFFRQNEDIDYVENTTQGTTDCKNTYVCELQSKVDD